MNPKKKYLFFSFKLLFVLLFLIFLSGCSKQNELQNMTNDHVLGPISFDGQVYFPAAYFDEIPENTEEIGSKEYKGENSGFATSLSSFLFGDDIGYISLEKGCNSIYLSSGREYVKSIEIEKKETDSDKKYFILNENWLEKVSMNKGGDIIHFVDSDLIFDFSNEFGAIDYDIDSFSSYDIYLGIFQSEPNIQVEDPDVLLNSDVEYIGCLLFTEGKWFYGNLDNEITGENLVFLNRNFHL